MTSDKDAADRLRELLALSRNQLVEHPAMERASPCPSVPSHDSPLEARAYLSRRCWELINFSTASTQVVEEIGPVFRRLQSSEWGDDSFGERIETLRVLAFVGWRHSRKLGQVPESQDWLEWQFWASIQASTANECTDKIPDAEIELARLREEPLVTAAESLMAVLLQNRSEWDRRPDRALARAVRLHEYLKADWPGDHFGELDYFRSEAALAAATTNRILGKFSDSRSWLREARARAESLPDAFVLIATADYIELTLAQSLKRFRLVAEAAPRLAEVFSSLHMVDSCTKVLFLEAAAMKDLGLVDEARRKLERLLPCGGPTGSRLEPWVLLSLADAYSVLGDHSQAALVLKRATARALEQNNPSVLANISTLWGQDLRDRGYLSEAVTYYREGIAAYAKLGMVVTVAYFRVLLSETLIALGWHEEAELELLAALPTIEEQQMSKDGLAAVALLRESIRRRKTDRNALKELREHLQRRH